MRVVVLMSTYNGERYLREQIESILNQIGEFDLSLYVRDDGSKDGTIEILREYQNEKKLKWYTGDNLGPAKSFINLLQNCGAYDYYAFADQDDVWEKDKIQRGINVLEEQNGPALYCSNAELVDLQLISLGRNVYKTMPRTDFETVISAGGLLGCTMVFNDELKRRIKRDRYPVMILHDFYMAALCVSIGGVILYDQEATMKYKAVLMREGILESKIIGLVPYFKNMTLVPRNSNYKDILFFGAMARPENSLSAIWFIENVLPRLTDLDIRFVILGSNPPGELKKYQSDRVYITGFVDSITPYFSQSMCLVAPLVLGAGIKIKVLEALSSGIPVLTNEIGIEGIPAKNEQEYFQCTKPEEYEAMIRCIYNKKFDEKYIENKAKEFIRENFSVDGFSSYYRNEIYRLGGKN